MSLSLGKTTRKVVLGVYFIMIGIIVAGIVAFATANINAYDLANTQTQSFSLNTGATGTLSILQGYTNDYPPPAIYRFAVAGMVLEIQVTDSGVKVLNNVGFSEADPAGSTGTLVQYNPTTDKYLVWLNHNGVQYLWESNPTTDGNFSFTYITSSQIELLGAINSVVSLVVALANGFVGLLLIFRGIRESGVSI